MSPSFGRGQRRRSRPLQKIISPPTSILTVHQRRQETPRRANAAWGILTKSNAMQPHLLHTPFLTTTIVLKCCLLQLPQVGWGNALGMMCSISYRRGSQLLDRRIVQSASHTTTTEGSTCSGDPTSNPSFKSNEELIIKKTGSRFSVQQQSSTIKYVTSFLLVGPP